MAILQRSSMINSMLFYVYSYFKESLDEQYIESLRIDQYIEAPINSSSFAFDAK